MPSPTPSLEIRGPAVDLLDEPLALQARGAGPEPALRWRARLRDDDERVWRAEAARAEDLAGGWAPAKAAATGPVAALRSLRPVTIEVRVEAPDGRAASRTVQRRLLAEGVRVRRWRAPVAGTLYRPADPAPAGPAALIDATAGGRDLDVAPLAAALLASRGVVVLVAGPAPRGPADLAAAADALRAVPGIGDPLTVPALVAPGVPTVEADPPPAERAEDWDALLARLGARSRVTAPRRG